MRDLRKRASSSGRRWLWSDIPEAGGLGGAPFDFSSDELGGGEGEWPISIIAGQGSWLCNRGDALEAVVSPTKNGRTDVGKKGRG